MTSSGDLIALVYLSAATVPFSVQELTELLAKSRANNSALGVSGMLLFKDGHFLQVLEGEREKVMELYVRISKDPRHRKATVLSQAELTRRDFPDWSMGFKHLEGAEARQMEGFSGLLDASLTFADFPEDPGRAKKLLLLFKEDKLLAKSTSTG